MDLRSSSFHFPSTEDTGPQSASAQFAFPRAVRQAAVGITGYSASFENGEDHHLGRLIVELNASVNGADPTKVDVSGNFGLRDWSGNWDDPYGGLVEFTLLADLVGIAPPAPGAPRGDLIVVDAEITQAIQHFRSDRHLDAANVFPDNSIRLVAAKPAVVRLYVDYDASSGLAPIASLSGELLVTVAGATTTIPASRAIAPRRDASIDRGQRDHTLNFLIPEALCQGTIDFVARVFDVLDRSQFSADFVRTLSFEAMPDLSIMAVGIAYTGDDVSDPTQLAAPTMADFTALFGFTEAVYPIPQVVISSFVTMSYDADVKSDINDGCDKMGDLKDAVAELRGDSDDIVYGLYNAGVDTGSVGGCGGGGAAVGRIGAQGTAAHEIGHALGRKHAPCDNVTRCAEPKNTDDDYPRYAGFDSDSIGEYGFDMRPAFGQVLPPSTAHDMMGYSGGRWISPYTYKALMSRIPEFAAGAAADAAFAAGRRPEPRGDWIAIKQPTLFLRFDILRDRSVRFQPAFHFDARPRPHGAEKTEFSIELLDEKGELLRTACLYVDETGCGCSCHGAGWPVKIRHAIAFDPRARSMVLAECEKELQRWPIPEPPKVSIDVDGADSKAGELMLRWDASAAANDEESLWFLVQWRDRRGTWRGAAPRTRKRSMAVPK
ncbi:MAG TPA: M66 family metalloprotease, partial [Burkholderiaceae bacterium]|nr:M66 family metalloprotease [Burkholderiaceae bacterium]